MVPTRSCLVCRRRSDKPSLIRVAVVDGTVVLDPSAQLSGRGAYLCSRPACADAALTRGAAKLIRALRADGGTQVDEQAIRSAVGAGVWK